MPRAHSRLLEPLNQAQAFLVGFGPGLDFEKLSSFNRLGRGATVQTRSVRNYLSIQQNDFYQFFSIKLMLIYLLFRLIFYIYLIISFTYLE